MPYIIVTSIISILVALLALQNAAATPVNFIIWQFEVPLICVILGAFLAGALVSSVVLMYSKFRHLVSEYKNNQEIRKLNHEIDGLRKNIALLTEPVRTMNVKAENVAVEDAAVKEEYKEETAGK